jgi:hypothetical protein
LSEHHLLEHLKHQNEEIIRLLNKLLREEHHTESATLTFLNSQGETLAMPLTIVVGQQFQAVFTEFSGPNGTGSIVPPVAVPSFASDTTGVATIDPVSGLGVGVSAGTANISGADSGDSLVASDVLTVQAASPTGAVSATITLTAGALPASRR